MADPTGLVAWEDLRVGETYWGCSQEWIEPCSFEVTRKGVGDLWVDEYEQGVGPHDFHQNPDGKPMIYATCAQACKAMIQRLEKFMAEQGEGNG